MKLEYVLRNINIQHSTCTTSHHNKPHACLPSISWPPTWRSHLKAHHPFKVEYIAGKGLKKKFCMLASSQAELCQHKFRKRGNVSFEKYTISEKYIWASRKEQFCMHAFKSSQVVAQFPAPRPALPKTAPADSSHVASATSASAQSQCNTQHATPSATSASASASATQTRSLALNFIKYTPKNYCTRSCSFAT